MPAVLIARLRTNCLGAAWFSRRRRAQAETGVTLLGEHGLVAGPEAAGSIRLADCAPSERSCCGHLLFEVEYSP
jgi:hypothetical protein